MTSAVAGALPVFAVPMVRRMPRSTALMASPAGISAPDVLWLIGDRRRAPADGAGLHAPVRHVGKVGADDPRRGGHRDAAARLAPGQEVPSVGAVGGAGHPRGAPKDEPEWFRRDARSKSKQHVAQHGWHVECDATAGFRIGPADCAEVHGDGLQQSRPNRVLPRVELSGVAAAIVSRFDAVRQDREC